MRRRKQTKRIILFALPSVVAGTMMAATLKVPDNYATVGAALQAAQPGDVIEITTTDTFTEDLTIDKPITIRGTNPNGYPMILAANTAERFAHIGIQGPDHLGTVVRVPGVTLEHLQFANLDPDLNSEDISAALLILAPKCTVRDCVIFSYEVSPGDGLGAAVADLDIAVGGTTPTDIVFSDCLFGTNKYGLAISWWIAPGIPPQVTISNCTFINNTSSGIEMDSGIVKVQDSKFVNNPGNAISMGGGQATCMSCLFATNGVGGSATIDVDLDPRWDDTDNAPVPGKIPPGDIKLIACRLFQNGQAGEPTLRIHEGTLEADHCIIANGLGPLLQMDAGGEPTAPATGIFDHCDIYGAQNSEEIKILADNKAQQITLTIHNSILATDLDGYLLFANELDPSNFKQAELAWCALYEPGITEAPLPGHDNLLFPVEEPPYQSTDPTAPNGFKLRPGVDLLTAGENGSYIGSNGAEKPVEVQPMTLSIKIQNHHPVLCWDSVEGITYAIQTTTDITQPNWTTKTTVVAKGTSTCWEDTDPSPVQFYRVVANP